MHRVLFLTENYPPARGGMAESCDRIVRGLGRAGVTIDLTCFDRKIDKPAFHATTTGSLLRWPLDADAAHTINCLWNRLQQAVPLGAVTHVLAFGGMLPLLAAPAFAAWIGRPLVTLLRGNELDAGLFDGRKRPALDDAIRRSATVCTVTTGQASKVAALFPGVTPEVIANGIDFDSWSATAADRARGRAWREANVASGRRVLGFFGHLKSKKGVSFFLDALRRTGHSDRFHLLLAGEWEDALREQLAAFPDHTQVAALDRFDLLPYFTACDLVVLPSHYDGFPNVLIEAMALGTPLIASNVGGMADVLDAGSAFLFEPGDEHGCAEAIACAAGAIEAVLRAMGERARTIAVARCDARIEAARYVDVLSALRPRSLTVVEE